MKKTFLQISLVILLTVISAAAQTQYRALIPFDFSIGQKNYKAGEYTVGLLNQNSQSKIIVIRDAKGKNSYAIMPSISNAKTESATLIFNRYAEQYFLTEINAPTFRAEFSKSKFEVKLGIDKKMLKETIALTK